MNGIIADLQPLIEGDVTADEKDLTAMSQDFGEIIQKYPQVIVRPQSASDIAKVIKYAAPRSIGVSSRGAGHSLSGQSLNRDGILLDMRCLNRIRDLQPDNLLFQADTGATWRQLVDAALPHRLIPPVLTNYFDVTLGGTHAAGGLGQSSFRYGSQADNCLGLEVVTGTGEVLWCSLEENSELFSHVLAGYGQFGIATQLRHKLKPYRPQTRTYFLCYDDLNAFLVDLQLLISEERVDGLLALFSPCVMGIAKGGQTELAPIIEWFYRMQITVEADSYEDINEAKLLGDLNFYRLVHTEELNFEQFIEPAITVPQLAETAKPWFDVFLPVESASKYIETALQLVPQFIDFRMTPIGCFSLVSSKINLPMLCLPKDEFVLGFGMYPVIFKSQLEGVLDNLKSLENLAFEMGGKRYLASWADLSIEQWQIQFGNYWGKVNELKQKYDPNRILNPGFIKYEVLGYNTNPETKNIQELSISSNSLSDGSDLVTDNFSNSQPDSTLLTAPK